MGELSPSMITTGQGPEPHGEGVGSFAAPRKLNRNEALRRLWHFSPGIVAIIAAVVPKVDSVAGLPLVFIVFGSLLLTAAAIRFQNSFSRSDEKNCLPAVLGYLVPALLVVCLFPDFPELVLTLMTVIAFGDGTATLCGMMYGSARLPWNPAKTWIGTIAFFAAAFPMGAFVYYNTAIPGVSPEVALACSGMSALLAAGVESLPLKTNDNFRVGIAAMSGVPLIHTLLVGF